VVDVRLASLVNTIERVGASWLANRERLSVVLLAPLGNTFLGFG